MKSTIHSFKEKTVDKHLRTIKNINQTIMTLIFIYQNKIKGIKNCQKGIARIEKDLHQQIDIF